MKTVCLLTTLAALIALGVCDPKADFEKYNKACLEEAHVTDAELKQFFTNGMKPADAKENIKCHAKCLMEKQGILQGGQYSEEAALNALKEIPMLKDHMPEIQQAIQKCKNEKGTNDCDTAFKITMCMKDHKSQITA